MEQKVRQLESKGIVLNKVQQTKDKLSKTLTKQSSTKTDLSFYVLILTKFLYMLAIN
jgi:hypothetical protein